MSSPNGKLRNHEAAVFGLGQAPKTNGGEAERARAAADTDPEGCTSADNPGLGHGHGLAMQMLDGQLPPEDDLIDQVIAPAALFPRAICGT